MIDPPVLGHLMPWLARLALILAMIGAVALARRRAEYRPIAALLVFLGFANAARSILNELVFQPAIRAGRLPFHGGERAAFHVEEGLFLSWPFGVAGLAVAVFLSKRRWPIVAAAYAAAVAVLVAKYPAIRQDLLAEVYLYLTLGCLVVAAGALAWRWHRRIPLSPPEITTFLFVTFLLATVLGPYTLGRVDTGWSLGAGLFAGMYGAIAVMEVAWLRRP